MAIKDLEVRRFDDFKSNVIQDNVKETFTQLKNIPFLDGVFLTNVELFALDLTKDINKISHKLFRKPIGMIATKQSTADVIVWTTADNKTVTLSTANPQIADIWIF